MLRDKCVFLTSLTSLILPLLSDYFDSIREEACIATEYLICNFIPQRSEPTKETAEFLQMVRATLAIGWNDSFSTPLREFTKLENEHVSFLFEDMQAFERQLVTVMMDEPTTKEAITRMLVRLNESMPFLLLNDYRLSVGANQPRRIDILKHLL